MKARDDEMKAQGDEKRIRRTLERFRPGPSYSAADMWSPMPAESPDRQDEQVSAEADTIARAVAELGVTTRKRLFELVGARFWGPGRFHRALHEALRTGRIERIRRGMYSKPAQHT